MQYWNCYWFCEILFTIISFHYMPIPSACSVGNIGRLDNTRSFVVQTITLYVCKASFTHLRQACRRIAVYNCRSCHLNAFQNTELSPLSLSLSAAAANIICKRVKVCCVPMFSINECVINISCAWTQNIVYIHYTAHTSRASTPSISMSCVKQNCVFYIHIYIVYTFVLLLRHEATGAAAACGTAVSINWFHLFVRCCRYTFALASVCFSSCVNYY